MIEKQRLPEERYNELQELLGDKDRIYGECIFGRCFIIKGHHDKADCIRVYVTKPEGEEYCDLLVHKEYSEDDNKIDRIMSTFKEDEERNTKERISETLSL